MACCRIAADDAETSYERSYAGFPPLRSKRLCSLSGDTEFTTLDSKQFFDVLEGVIAVLPRLILAVNFQPRDASADPG